MTIPAGLATEPDQPFMWLRINSSISTSWPKICLYSSNVITCSIIDVCVVLGTDSCSCNTGIDLDSDIKMLSKNILHMLCYQIVGTGQVGRSRRALLKTGSIIDSLDKIAQLSY